MGIWCVFLVLDDISLDVWLGYAYLVYANLAYGTPGF